MWAGWEKRWHFNCFLRDLALAADFHPTPPSLWCIFPPKQFLALVDVGTVPPSPPTSSSLSQWASLTRLGTDGQIQQMFYQAGFVPLVAPPPPTFLSFSFSCSRSLISPAECRMALGWGVNEVICICPKLFAVDCFEEEPQAEGRKTTLSCSKYTKCSQFWRNFVSRWVRYGPACHPAFLKQQSLCFPCRIWPSVGWKYRQFEEKPAEWPITVRFLSWETRRPPHKGSMHHIAN